MYKEGFITESGKICLDTTKKFVVKRGHLNSPPKIIENLGLSILFDSRDVIILSLIFYPYTKNT